MQSTATGHVMRFRSSPSKLGLDSRLQETCPCIRTGAIALVPPHPAPAPGAPHAHPQSINSHKGKAPSYCTEAPRPSVAATGVASASPAAPSPPASWPKDLICVLHRKVGNGMRAIPLPFRYSVHVRLVVSARTAVHATTSQNPGFSHNKG